ncbi:hypothetical protein N7456_010228 [Penicillium angulare]|uniref:Rhodopsin domain-containing protein n=1 Tax=Penicillium angulare TaxID=116970 RepID=A0A9W9K6W2_9EURO|nr:hypothetical protein N7456_010228 [Penicillium angulare]
MMTLVFVALVIRAWARLKSHRKVLLEDILILLAAALFYSDQAVYLYAVMGNGASGGSDSTGMSLTQLDRYSKYLYAEEMLFVLGITAVKLSILVFYRHVFTTRSFAKVNWVIIGITVVWCIITLFLVIFQCSPIHGVWSYEMQFSGQATCLNSPKLIFGFEVTNVVIDVSILIPPIVMVQRLQLRAAKRVKLTIIFFLGLFVCITCAVRAHFIWNPSTGQARSIPIAMDWTTVEMASAIVCACLPTYGPVISNLSDVVPSLKSWYSSLLSSMHKTSQVSADGDRKSCDGSEQSFDLHSNYYHMQCRAGYQPSEEARIEV